MTAGEIMTEHVVTVGETTAVGKALELLSELEIRHLPVVRDGEVVGMLSDRDVRGVGLSLVTDLESLDRIQARLTTPVSTLMSSNVIAVGPEAELDEVIDLMLDEKVGAVPVVDEETSELRGLVSYVDVLRALRETSR